jgi:hypothetical protein
MRPFLITGFCILFLAPANLAFADIKTTRLASPGTLKECLFYSEEHQKAVFVFTPERPVAAALEKIAARLQLRPRVEDVPPLVFIDLKSRESVVVPNVPPKSIRLCLKGQRWLVETRAREFLLVGTTREDLGDKDKWGLFLTAGTVSHLSARDERFYFVSADPDGGHTLRSRSVVDGSFVEHGSIGHVHAGVFSSDDRGLITLGTTPGASRRSPLRLNHFFRPNPEACPRYWPLPAQGEPEIRPPEVRLSLRESLQLGLESLALVPRNCLFFADVGKEPRAALVPLIDADYAVSLAQALFVDDLAKTLKAPDNIEAVEIFVVNGGFLLVGRDKKTKETILHHGGLNDLVERCLPDKRFRWRLAEQWFELARPEMDRALTAFAFSPWSRTRICRFSKRKSLSFAIRTSKRKCSKPPLRRWASPTRSGKRRCLFWRTSLPATCRSWRARRKMSLQRNTCASMLGKGNTRSSGPTPRQMARPSAWST